MANILDYLDWRGDLTLAQDPFNEVDNLILAELSFVDFGGIVPGPGEGRAVPLWKAAEAYFAKTGRPAHRHGRSGAQSDPRAAAPDGSLAPVPGHEAQRLCGPSGHGEGGAVRGAGGRVRGWHRLPLLPGHRRYAGRVERGFLSELYAGGPRSEEWQWHTRRPWPISTPGSSCGWAAIPRAAIWQCAAGVFVSHGGAAADQPPSGPMTAPASMTIFCLRPGISGWRSVSTPLCRNPPW